MKGNKAKMKRIHKTIIYVTAGITAIALIGVILLVGRNHVPNPVDEQPEPEAPSPSVSVEIAPIPSVEPSLDDNNAEADDEVHADLIIDLETFPQPSPDTNITIELAPSPAAPLEPKKPSPAGGNNAASGNNNSSSNSGSAESGTANDGNKETSGGGIEIGSSDASNTVYNCDTASHKCNTPTKHAYIQNLEIEGCKTCGSHSCKSFYALNQWGYTHYTPSKCPEYNKQKDPVHTCQECGKPTGNGKSGTCVRFVTTDDCPKCGENVSAWTCHSCN